jgi:hypothetical protein
MKRSKTVVPELEARFGKDKLERVKMQYLLGGDENGGQPGDDAPWNPGG